MPGVDREHSFELTDNWSLDELQFFWDGLVLETTLCRWGGNLSPEEAADRMNAQFPNRTNKFTGDMLRTNYDEIHAKGYWAQLNDQVGPICWA